MYLRMLFKTTKSFLHLRCVTSTARSFASSRHLSTDPVTDALFTRLLSENITPPSPIPLAGRTFLVDSEKEDFPKFLGKPRDDFPYSLTVKDVNQSSLKVLAGKCREVLDERLPLYGAVLFRGLPLTSVKRLAEFTGALGYDPMDYLGGSGQRSAIDRSSFLFNSADEPKELNIVMHQEMANSTIHPQKVVFCCLHPSHTGGITPLAKRSEMFADLDQDIVRRLQEKQVCYLRWVPDKSNTEYVSWQQCFATEDPKVAEQFLEEAGYQCEWNKTNNGLLYWHVLPPMMPHPLTGELIWFNQITSHHNTYLMSSPISQGVDISDNMYPLHTTYGNGDEIEPEVIRHIRNAKWRNAVGFYWRSGDVMVLDNMAMFHGRLSYSGDRQVVAYLSRN